MDISLKIACSRLELANEAKLLKKLFTKQEIKKAD